MMYRFTGVDRQGNQVHGQIDLTAGSPLTVRVEKLFRAGWRSLRVAAGPGPVPPPLGAELCAAIEPHYHTGRRTWWSES